WTSSSANGLGGSGGCTGRGLIFSAGALACADAAEGRTRSAAIDAPIFVIMRLPDCDPTRHCDKKLRRDGGAPFDLWIEDGKTTSSAPPAGLPAGDWAPLRPFSAVFLAACSVFLRLFFCLCAVAR